MRVRLPPESMVVEDRRGIVPRNFGEILPPSVLSYMRQSHPRERFGIRSAPLGGTEGSNPSREYMIHTTQSLTSGFIAWCAIHHNSPDITNLKWWLENRMGNPEADLGAILEKIKTDKEDPRFFITGLKPRYHEEAKAERVEDLL